MLQRLRQLTAIAVCGPRLLEGLQDGRRHDLADRCANSRFACDAGQKPHRHLESALLADSVNSNCPRTKVAQTADILVYAHAIGVVPPVFSIRTGKTLAAGHSSRLHSYLEENIYTMPA